MPSEGTVQAYVTQWLILFAYVRAGAVAEQRCLRRTLLNAGLLRFGESFIEFEVQFEYVDSGFSKKPELAIFRMFCQQRMQLVYGDSALFGDRGQLEFGCRGSNVRIES